eukprot:gene14749-58847_t
MLSLHGLGHITDDARRASRERSTTRPTPLISRAALKRAHGDVAARLRREEPLW